MYTIEKKEFNKFKKDLENWLEIAFEEGSEKRYYEDGILWKESKNTFCYDFASIEIAISAACDPESGEVKSSFFDDIEVIDDKNIEYKRGDVNELQTAEINRIVKTGL